MHKRRKADHLRISLEEDVQFEGLTTGFERYQFIHQALPEMGFKEVDLSLNLFGKRLEAPLIISSMTGGIEPATKINRNLARAAQKMGVAMGVGSLRPAIDDPSLARTYQVREVAPDILLFANLGAVQLNYGYGVEECRHAVEMIEADALILHLNPLQECLQEEGNTDFSGLLARIEKVCRHLPVPVMVKEVGWGISEEVARRLAQAGVAAIDVAGAGGTSWSEVERYRTSNEMMKNVAAAFAQWGIPTADSIRMARRGAPDVALIASGGIRTGVDVAKAIALGADGAALATPLLKAANASWGTVREKLDEIIEELRITMFCIGARNLRELKETPNLREREP
ncbi:MAG: type 2 isopentenyl-diphosphate Delta-isomerase [Anaerolineae bacterium]|nr:type 2 isopentenyl-diphosphate Delta-isomerase [Anaerolineae bacterium]